MFCSFTFDTNRLRIAQVITKQNGFLTFGTASTSSFIKPGQHIKLCLSDYYGILHVIEVDQHSSTCGGNLLFPRSKEQQTSEEMVAQVQLQFTSYTSP